MNLRDLRKSYGLLQKEAADICEISLRSYIRYENDPKKVGTLKYERYCRKLESSNMVDEEHGVLKKDAIVQTCKSVFDEYNVEYCYLFGSYAKGKANETSDIDLAISTATTGIEFYGLVELLRERLRKKVDLIRVDKLADNLDLLNEVMKDGERIYG